MDAASVQHRERERDEETDNCGVAALACVCAAAQRTGTNDHAAVGAGLMTCGKWLADRQAQARTGFDLGAALGQSWALGNLTALNATYAYVAKTPEAALPDPDVVSFSIDKLCRESPADRVMDVLPQLMKDIIARQ